ncbi:nucleoside diphosphate kinase regulator [Geoalkalibacter sp.]|uniref:nucleoside diphosphate kinase regulator n=1 Tax=Geoalkalibacter sp. TaxID=3041440 RepID=UPI00272E522A|nr:nucleoside diphosphate kinase regulator [Geoalkalibacter sp.]
MNERALTFTDYDVERIEDLLEGARNLPARKREGLEALAEELGRGRIVASRQVPSDIVTLNSRVRLRDLDGDRVMEVTLVLPGSADLAQGRLSVTSPIGMAILGFAQGDIVEWAVPAGVKKICIEEILYQPEAAGHFHL